MQRAKGVGLYGLATLALLIVTTLAHAARPLAFDAKAFLAAQKLGNPILVEISADWCPNCMVQHPIVDGIFCASKYSNVTRFRIDFDVHEKAAKRFNVRFLSTLVLFKGKTEVARSEGELDEAKIRSMLNKAL